jgi:uncharacterized protein (TIGR00661 family)
MKKILFYCSAGGYGHITRSIATINHLKNVEIHIASSSVQDFAKPNINFHPLPKTGTNCKYKLGGADSEALMFSSPIEKGLCVESYGKYLFEYANLLKRINPDLVVIDITPEITLLTKFFGYKVIHIYETMNTNVLRYRLAWNNADMIISPYPKGFYDPHKKYKTKTFFSGGFSRFDNVKVFPKAKAKIKLGIKKDTFLIMLTFGEGRLGNSFMEQSVETVDKLSKNLNIKCLSFAPHKTDEIASLAKKYKNVKFITDVYDLKDYINASDLAISSAGYGSVMEFSSFRVPMILFPLKRVHQEQEIKSKMFSSINAAISMDKNSFTKLKLENPILRLIKNKKLLRKMSAAQRIIVDKQGGKRAAGAIMNFLNTK